MRRLAIVVLMTACGGSESIPSDAANAPPPCIPGVADVARATAVVESIARASAAAVAEPADRAGLVGALEGLMSNLPFVAHGADGSVGRHGVLSNYLMATLKPLDEVTCSAGLCTVKYGRGSLSEIVEVEGTFELQGTTLAFDLAHYMMGKGRTPIDWTTSGRLTVDAGRIDGTIEASAIPRPGETYYSDANHVSWTINLALNDVQVAPNGTPVSGAFTATVEHDVLPANDTPDYKVSAGARFSETP